MLTIDTLLPKSWATIFDFIKCPFCGGTDFGSLNHSSVWCSNCNARFSCRCTGGDPGLVIDVYGDHLYANEYQCTQCEHKVLSMPTLATCPSCSKDTLERTGIAHGHHYADVDEKGRAWCGIFKIGDYISAWSGVTKDLRKKAPFCHTQEEWDAWQEQQEK